MAQLIVPFTPNYGEPDWANRPFWNGERDQAVTPTNDRSYEENRMMQEGLFRASQSDSHVETSSGWNRSLPLINPFFSKHQATYLRWSQSPSVHVLIGHDEDLFHLPSDFLTRRSIVFRVMLESHFDEANTRIIRLPETSKETFQHVILWMLCPQPHKHQSWSWSFSVAVDLAIFATIYIVPSLLHQSLDFLRDTMSRSENPWTPELLDRIYSQADESSMLRKMTRIAVAHLGRAWTGFAVKSRWFTRWQEVFEQHSALGVDYFTAQVQDWQVTDLMLGGPCRFHQHDQKILLTAAVPEKALFICPYLHDEYFEEVPASQKFDKGTRNDNTKIKKEESDSAS